MACSNIRHLPRGLQSYRRAARRVRRIAAGREHANHRTRIHVGLNCSFGQHRHDCSPTGRERKRSDSFCYPGFNDGDLGCLNREARRYSKHGYSRHRHDEPVRFEYDRRELRVDDAGYSTAATLDAGSSRVPYVAEKWSTSPDGLTHTINIRKGFLWDDGQPLTAQDLKFVAEFEATNKFSWKAALVGSDTVASMETPDDYTLVVKMAQPLNSFLSEFLYWFRIMPKHIWESVPDPKTYTNEKPIGAGPLKLSQWQKSQFIELEARKDYDFPPVGRPPYVDKLIYRIYPDVNTLALALQNGTIDAAPSGVPADSVDSVKSNPDLDVIHNKSTGYNEVNFNVGQNKYLADVKVRQALAMAVDKQAIVQLSAEGIWRRHGDERVAGT